MKKVYKFLLNKLPRPLLIRLSYVFKFFAPLIYKGNKVECPVCDRKFRKFLSYGSNVSHRENVLCPYDLTLERHRLMWLYLKRESNFFTADKLKVLHIAPEQCFHKTFKKQKNLDYLTGDLLSPIADMHFDLHQIPLEDNRFDVVFCNHVMEHVDDALKCMKELHRVMAPGALIDKRIKWLEVVGNKVKATYYYDNGKIQQEGFFKDGKLDGVWVSYDEKGNKKTVGEYADGIKTGKWIYFNEDSLKEVAYVDNKVSSVKNLQKNALANRN